MSPLPDDSGRIMLRARGAGDNPIGIGSASREVSERLRCLVDVADSVVWSSNRD